jgi:hypothetical protein
MYKKANTIKASTVIVALLLICFAAVSGCKPPAIATQAEPAPTQPVETDTPVPTAVEETVEPLHSVVVLPDGSKVILKPDAVISIISQPGLPGNNGEVLVLVERGEILVVPNRDGNNWFTALSPNGEMARVQGCSMLVQYDQTVDSYEMMCIGGNCEAVSRGNGREFLVASGKSHLFQAGNAMDQTDIDLEWLLNDYGEFLPECGIAMINGIPVTGATATPTLVPTVDLDATATAACSSFQQEFPATPCP